LVGGHVVTPAHAHHAHAYHPGSLAIDWLRPTWALLNAHWLVAMWLDVTTHILPTHIILDSLAIDWLLPTWALLKDHWLVAMWALLNAHWLLATWALLKDHWLLATWALLKDHWLRPAWLVVTTHIVPTHGFLGSLAIDWLRPTWLLPDPGQVVLASRLTPAKENFSSCSNFCLSIPAPSFHLSVSRPALLF